MGLPKLDTPTYELTLPSNGNKVKYRPFLVKEEKILLMAMESNDQKDMLEAVKQIINNCIITDNIDVNDMPVFDIEYFFLQLRSRSVGETVTINYKNSKCLDDPSKDCGNELTGIVDLASVNVIKDENHNLKVDLSDKISVIMKYPKLDLAESVDLNDSDKIFDIIKKCMKVIVDGDDTYEVDDFSSEDLDEFISSMTQSQFTKIKDFFETMPTLKHTVSLKCMKCNKQTEIELKGLNDFFG